MKANENKEERRIVEEQRRAEEKEKTAKEDDRIKRVRRGPRRRELTNYRRTFK